MNRILITGGGKRMGAELAQKFHSKGWEVIITYNNTAPQEQNYFKKAFKCNLNSSDEIKKLFIHLKVENLIPEVLLNNAGVFPKKSSLKDLEEAVWDDTMDINLKAHYLTSQGFQSIAEHGRIINIASLGGLEIWNHRIPYNVSKAAAIRLTEVLAREMAPNFSVNCICPGTILLDGEPIEPVQNTESKVPMGRHGNIDDMFDLIYFFSTASKYITGQIVNVDGGYSLVKYRG